MCIGKVVVYAHHTVVFAGVAFIRGDQFAGPIPIVWSVRRSHQIEKRLYRRIDRNGDTATRVGVAAGGRIRSGWQETLVGEGIGHRSDCSRRLYLPKPLVVDKEERVITLQWPTESGAELIADELRDRTGAQIEVVLRVSDAPRYNSHKDP